MKSSLYLMEKLARWSKAPPMIQKVNKIEKKKRKI
jgi:hypothetical protein